MPDVCARTLVPVVATQTIRGVTAARRLVLSSHCAKWHNQREPTFCRGTYPFGSASEGFLALFPKTEVRRETGDDGGAGAHRVSVWRLFC
jgi:hypothetical protein